MISPLEQASIPCLLEDKLGRTVLTRTLGRKQSSFGSKVPKMWFILTDSLLQIDSSGNRSANNWETWEITSFTNVGRIPKEQKNLKKTHPNAFTININTGTKSECFLIDCDSREQRVKWTEAFRSLITMHTCEAMVGPPPYSMVQNYVKFLLTEVKQALRLTCQLRGIAKSLEEYYSGDSNPLQTANHELGKTALTSLGLVLQLVKSPFSFKTSEGGAFVSCLKAWVDYSQAVTREGGGSLQLDLVQRKIEEQVTKILEMKQITGVDVVMGVFGDILDRLRWTEKDVTEQDVIVVKENVVNLIKSLHLLQPELGKKYSTVENLCTQLGDHVNSLFILVQQYTKDTNDSLLVKLSDQKNKIIDHMVSIATEFDGLWRTDIVQFIKQKS